MVVVLGLCAGGIAWMSRVRIGIVSRKYCNVAIGA